MRVLFIVCGLLLFGCQHAENRQHKDRLELPKLQAQKKEHHLFLNYYFGMSIAEYEQATRHNFMSKEVFLPGEKHDCELNRYGRHHTREDIENINYHSTVFYEFSVGRQEFEAVVKPVFKYEKLVRIELQTLNCFNFGNHRHEFYRKKIDDTRQALIDLHVEQFGKFKVSPKRHTDDDLSVIQNAGVDIKQFDTNKYVFNHANKVITIEQKCCDFKPLVIYTHSEFHDIQQQPNSPEKLERELRLLNSVAAL